MIYYFELICYSATKHRIGDSSFLKQVYVVLTSGLKRGRRCFVQPNVEVTSFWHKYLPTESTCRASFVNPQVPCTEMRGLI